MRLNVFNAAAAFWLGAVFQERIADTAVNIPDGGARSLAYAAVSAAIALLIWREERARDARRAEALDAQREAQHAAIIRAGLTAREAMNIASDATERARKTVNVLFSNMARKHGEDATREFFAEAYDSLRNRFH